ncbi:ankyrin repeat-containing domain protein [Rhexocercosporidium sp. MPI-PUGE-AT-0058]|nr:ankyrin repeat-containing domain protein [Rhexocercosporidium sp. MPI-PUGE-AT-0058]
MQECRGAFNKLKAVLPANVEGNQGLASELLRKFQRLLKDREIIGLRENIAHSTASLQLLLHMIAIDAIRNVSGSQELGQQLQREISSKLDVVEQGIVELQAAMSNRLNSRNSSENGLDTDRITINIQQTLNSAQDFTLRTRSTIYAPTGSSMVRSAPHRAESASLSIPDSAYDSDTESPLGAIPISRNEFTESMLTDLINRSLSGVKKHLQEAKYAQSAEARKGEYDLAAGALASAIGYSRERLERHKHEFRGERGMLRELAVIHRERCMYPEAEAILQDLLQGMEEDCAETHDLYHTLATTYLAHGKLENAATSANKANDARQKVLVRGHSAIVETLTLLAQIYDRMGHHDPADIFRAQALRHRIWRKGLLDEKMESTLKSGDGEDGEDKVQQILAELGEPGEREILALKAFQWAVVLNKLPIARVLMESFSIIASNIDAQNAFGMTALTSAVAFGHEEMVRFLVENRADVNARSSNEPGDDTALMHACLILNMNIVSLLLDRNANVRDVNKFGRNALHWTLSTRPKTTLDAIRQEEIATKLLRKNKEALINCPCYAGRSPLSLAAEHDNVPLMQLLLKNEADLEARDPSDRTPLLIAIDYGSPNAVQLLLERGADPRAKNIYGKSASKAARRAPSSAGKIRAAIKKAKKIEPASPQRTPSIAGLSSNWSGSQVSTLTLSPTFSRQTLLTSSRRGSLAPSIAYNPERLVTPGTIRPSNRAPSVSSSNSGDTTVTNWSLFSSIRRVGRD